MSFSTTLSHIHQPWKRISDNQLFRRSGFACGIYNDRFILMAGGFHRQRLLSAFVYDTYSHTCCQLPDLPSDITALGGCKGAVVNGYFYVDTMEKIYRISLSTRSKWELVYFHKIQRLVRHSVVSEEKDLLLFNEHGLLILYDTKVNECVHMPQMATRRYAYAFAVVDENIFMIGGFGGHHQRYLSSVEVFNIPTRSWSTTSPLPKPLRSSNTTVVGEYIVVTGGQLEDNSRNHDTFIFDTLTRMWAQKDNKTTFSSRSGHHCVSIKSQIFFIGGKDDIANTYYSLETVNRKDLICNWEIMKHFILLRKLVDERRAVAIVQDDIVLQKLMLDLNLDMFRQIISFF